MSNDERHVVRLTRRNPPPDMGDLGARVYREQNPDPVAEALVNLQQTVAVLMQRVDRLEARLDEFTRAITRTPPPAGPLPRPGRKEPPR
jgi:hypothetical protein